MGKIAANLGKKQHQDSSTALHMPTDIERQSTGPPNHPTQPGSSAGALSNTAIRALDPVPAALQVLRDHSDRALSMARAVQEMEHGWREETKARQEAQRRVIELESKLESEKEGIRQELEKRLKEENKARQEAERRVSELQIEKKDVRHELDSLRERLTWLVDEKMKSSN